MLVARDAYRSTGTFTEFIVMFHCEPKIVANTSNIAYQIDPALISPKRTVPINHFNMYGVVKKVFWGEPLTDTQFLSRINEVSGIFYFGGVMLL